MFSNKLSTLIEKDETTIACKKRAKELFRIHKASANKQSLMQCQSVAASELGFKDWFDLQNTIKKKHEFQIKLGYEILVDDFHNLLQEAAESENIHIEVREQIGYIKIRKDGILNFYKDGNAFTAAYLNDLCHTIVYEIGKKYHYHNEFDFKKVSLLAGEYTINDNNNNLNNFFIGLQSIPAYPHGYDLILKLTPQFKQFNLKKLGLEDNQIHDLMNVANQTSGTLFLAGVTGSGKTTTMNTLLKEINSFSNYSKKIYTIESPVEYKIDNVTQINIDPRSYFHNQFSAYTEELETCVNNQADLILISDTYSKATAQAVTNAAKSAFLMSTIHASSALGIILRLQDFDISNEEMANSQFLKTLGYQKLLPIVCDHCHHLVDELFNNEDKNIANKNKYLRFFKELEQVYPNIDITNVKLRNSNGCEHCNQNGIKGRTACAEIITLDNTMYKLIKDNNLEELQSYWLSLSDNDLASPNMRGKRVMEHALYKMLKGQIDPLDIESRFMSPSYLKRKI